MVSLPLPFGSTQEAEHTKNLGEEKSRIVLSLRNNQIIF